MQAVLYVAERLVRKDFHKIFKILYFADREHLSEYGRPITGDTYIAMPDGPVPSTIYDIFKIVRGDANSFFVSSVSSELDFRELFNVKERSILEPLKPADHSVLSESDMETLDAILEEYGNMTWGEIREKSHDLAWQRAATTGYDPMSIEDILAEKGDSSSYIDYITKDINSQKSISI